MALNYIQNLIFQKAQAHSIVSTQATQEIYATPTQAPIGANNPFLLSDHNKANQAYRQIGVNQPFSKPLFLGYRDEKPLYGGSRLFILS